MEGIPKTRQEAIQRGSDYYFTNVPCIRGHIAPRFTSNKNCRDCINARNRERTTKGYWKGYGNLEYKRKKREAASDHYKKHKHLYRDNSRIRRKRLLLASVFNEEGERRMKLKYLEAQRLTLETGVEYVVDHIVPLAHKLVCGLHNDANTQIVTAEENARKHNSFSIEDD